MLPNHAPLVIAEQFGTLASLYPGRIDLGLGRAPGTDQRTVAGAAARPGQCRQLPAGRLGAAGPSCPGPTRAGGAGRARRRPRRADLDPGLEPVRCPARRHARPALCFRLAFRARPARAGAAALPRQVRAFEQLQAPYAMVGVNVVAAETDAEARRLFTSAQQAFTNLFRGTRGQLLPPIDDIETYWTPPERIQASEHACAAPSSDRPRRCGGG